MVWTLLHLTEANAVQGNSEAATQTLRAAADSHLMLGGQQDLTAELAALPRTRALLAALPPEAYERALCHAKSEVTPVARVHLVTLGRIEIQVNGHPVRTRLRRAVEVLAFLLLRGPTRLETLQDEVLHGMPLARSRNYLHQVRHKLGRLLPGLGVLYDADTRTYGLQAEGIELTCDWQQLGERMRASPGEFLQGSSLGALDFFPGIGSEWIRQERERVSRWIVRVGLETMEDWYQVGNYAGCVNLAERLIEIEPLDGNLHDFLIRATFELQGRGAASARCRESGRMFAREVGHVPQSLQELSRQLDGGPPEGLRA